MGVFGLAPLTGLASWKDGKLTHYPELAGQSVEALLEDREGTVWAGGCGGIGQVRDRNFCAIQSGSAQCYGEDGGFGQWVGSLYEDSGRQSLGSGSDRAVAMEAWSSETLSDADARIGSTQR